MLVIFKITFPNNQNDKNCAVVIFYPVSFVTGFKLNDPHFKLFHLGTFWPHNYLTVRQY